MGGWPVEAGAEFVHGNTSAFTRLCAEFAREDASRGQSHRSLRFNEKPWPDRWWFGRHNRLTTEEPEEIERLHELMDAVGDERPPAAGFDVPADRWLAQKGASPLMLATPGGRQ